MATKSITLPEDLKRFAEERMKSGRYGSIIDVVRDAFTALRQDEERIQQMRTEGKKGFDQLDAGQGTELSADEVLERSDRRLGLIQ